MTNQRHDPVDHPAHYTSHPSGVECIQVVEHMGFNLGNAVKYVWRADLKDDAIEDLRKARWYLDREIARRTGPAVPEDDPQRLAPELNEVTLDELRAGWRCGVSIRLPAGLGSARCGCTDRGHLARWRAALPALPDPPSQAADRERQPGGADAPA